MEAGDYSPNEAEEKARLISQVLELQNTLDDLTNRVDAVKEENLKLRSENSVLGQYIENLMQASAVFQAVSPRSRRKHRPPGGNQLGTDTLHGQGCSLCIIRFICCPWKILAVVIKC